MYMLNTDRKQDLKKFAQAIMLVEAKQIVSLDEIILLEFSGTKEMVNYLLFQVGAFDYDYRNNELRVSLHE